MNDGGGNGARCGGIKVRTDTDRRQTDGRTIAYSERYHLLMSFLSVLACVVLGWKPRLKRGYEYEPNANAQRQRFAEPLQQTSSRLSQLADWQSV